MEIRYNRGVIIRTNNGYHGEISVDGVKMPIVCSFWSKARHSFIWIQREKDVKFNEQTQSFTEYRPKPGFECYAYKTSKNDKITYRGEFMFVGFKYNLMAWFEDKSEHQLNIEIERAIKQPIIERLNKLNKEKHE